MHASLFLSIALSLFGRFLSFYIYICIYIFIFFSFHVSIEDGVWDGMGWDGMVSLIYVEFNQPIGRF